MINSAKICPKQNKGFASKNFVLGKLYISLHCIEYCYFPCLCYCWSRCLVFVVFPSALDFYFLLGCHLSGCACGDFRFCFCFCFVFFICLDFCFLPACQVGADLRIHPSSGLLFPFERSRLYYIFTNNTISLCLLKCKIETFFNNHGIYFYLLPTLTKFLYIFQKTCSNC